MTIDRAIEILEGVIPIFSTPAPWTSDRAKAIQLGIEALKNKQDIRQSIYSSITESLPSETDSNESE